MWHPVLAWQELLAEKKQAAFLSAESVPLVVPLEPSQVQTVPRWKRLVQAAVALLVLLSPQAFLLLMFPAHAQNDLSAIGEQSAAFHESANLVAGAAAQVRQHSVHIPASWAEEYLREEQASP